MGMSLPFGAPHVDPADLIIAKGTAAMAAFNSARAARTAAAAAPARTTYATPVVRGLARKLGVDLASVKGTGAAGRITPTDVRAAAPAVVAPTAAQDGYPSSWKRPEPGSASTANFAAPAPVGAGTAYPAHWDRSPLDADTPTVTGHAAQAPAPTAGRDAGIAYPADWAR